MIAKIGFLIGILLMMGSVVVAQEATAEPKAGDTRTDAKGIAQVYVPAGCFMMGSSDEELDAALKIGCAGMGESYSDL